MYIQCLEKIKKNKTIKMYYRFKYWKIQKSWIGVSYFSNIWFVLILLGQHSPHANGFWCSMGDWFHWETTHVRPTKLPIWKIINKKNMFFVSCSVPATHLHPFATSLPLSPTPLATKMLLSILHLVFLLAFLWFFSIVCRLHNYD